MAKTFKAERKMSQRFERKEERKFKEGTSRSRHMNDAQVEQEYRRQENIRAREDQRRMLAAVERQNGVHDSVIAGEIDGLFHRRSTAQQRGASARAQMLDILVGEDFTERLRASMVDYMEAFFMLTTPGTADPDEDWWKSLYPGMVEHSEPISEGFSAEEFITMDKELIVLPYPSRLGKIREERPKDYAILMALLHQGGMRMLTDEEARTRGSMTHDIVLAFGAENLRFVRRQGAKNALPLTSLLPFVAERMKRSAFLLRRTMAAMSMQPVARKVNLD